MKDAKMSDDLYLSQKQVIYDLIRYFDMFAGIGGFRAGFDRAGGLPVRRSL